jgi:hypothetical protein
LILSIPDASAFVSPDKEIIHKELWEKSAQIAHFVLSKHLTKNSPFL